MIGFSIPGLEETTARFRALNQEIDRAAQSFRLGVPRLVPAALPAEAESELPPAERFGEPIAEPRGFLEFPDLLPDLKAITDSLGAISTQIDEASKKLGEGVDALTGALDQFSARELKIVVEGVTTPPTGDSLLGAPLAIPGADGTPLGEQIREAILDGFSAGRFVAIFTGNPGAVGLATAAGAVVSFGRHYLPSDLLATTDTEASKSLQRIGQVSKEDFGNANDAQRQQMTRILLEENERIETLIKEVEEETNAKIREGRFRAFRPDTVRQTEALIRLDTLRDVRRRARAYSAEVLGDDLPPELRELAPIPSQPAPPIEPPAIPQPAPKEFKARIELVMHSSEKIDVRRIVSDPDFTVDFYCGMNRAGTGLP